MTFDGIPPREPVKGERSYVVTGAAGTIGTAIVQRLLQDDGVVVAVDLPGTDFSRLEANGALACPGSVADRQVLERAADLAGNRLSGWVNNAASFSAGAAADLDVDQLRESFEVNLIAPILGSQIAVRRFLATSTPGAIVNISSIMGISAFPGWLPYGVAKAGVNALARSIAVDYGAFGIRANAVAPGTIRTPTFDRMEAANPDGARRICQRAANRRVGLPWEVADLVAFLLSDSAANITGVTLPIDGGRTIYDSDT